MYFQVVKHIHAKDTIEEAPPLGPHRNRPAASPGNSPVSPVVLGTLGNHGMFQQLQVSKPLKLWWKIQTVSVFHTEKNQLYIQWRWLVTYKILKEPIFCSKKRPPWLYHSDPSRRTPGRSWAFVPPAPDMSNGDVGQITGMSQKKRKASIWEKKTKMCLKTISQLIFKGVKRVFVWALENEHGNGLSCLFCTIKITVYQIGTFPKTPRTKWYKSPRPPRWAWDRETPKPWRFGHFPMVSFHDCLSLDWNVGMFFHPSEFLIKINDTINKSIRTHQSQLLHQSEQLKKKQIPPSANSSEIGRKKKGWFGGQVFMNVQGQRCDLSTSQSTLHDSNWEHPAFYCGYRLQFLSFTMGHYGRSSMGYSWPGMSKVYIISAQSTPLRSLSPYSLSRCFLNSGYPCVDVSVRLILPASLIQSLRVY